MNDLEERVQKALHALPGSVRGSLPADRGVMRADMRAAISAAFSDIFGKMPTHVIVPIGQGVPALLDAQKESRKKLDKLARQRLRMPRASTDL